MAGIDPRYLEDPPEAEGERGSLGAQLTELEKKYSVGQSDE